ncbi:hypothetical protein ACRS8P_29175 [Burkholderia cenocepacia]
MTFFADPVRMGLDDAEIAVVSKLKNAHMVDSADKLLVKSHKCPRRDSCCGLGREDFTPGADCCSVGSVPKIAENINKTTPGLFVNMVIFANKVIEVYPAFREFYGMEEVIEPVVPKMIGQLPMFFENLSHTTVWRGFRNISGISDSTCSIISKSSAACFAAPDARQIVQNEAGLSIVA